MIASAWRPPAFDGGRHPGKILRRWRRQCHTHPGSSDAFISSKVCFSTGDKHKDFREGIHNRPAKNQMGRNFPSWDQNLKRSAMKPQPKDKTFAPRSHGVTEKTKDRWVRAGSIYFLLFSVAPWCAFAFWLRLRRAVFQGFWFAFKNLLRDCRSPDISAPRSAMRRAPAPWPRSPCRP